LRYRIIAFAQNVAAKKLQKHWMLYANSKEERIERERLKKLKIIKARLTQLYMKERVREWV
jgi:hypothetical protein